MVSTIVSFPCETLYTITGKFNKNAEQLKYPDKLLVLIALDTSIMALFDIG